MALVPDLADALVSRGEYARADAYLERSVVLAAEESGDLRLHTEARIVQDVRPIRDATRASPMPLSGWLRTRSSCLRRLATTQHCRRPGG